MVSLLKTFGKGVLYVLGLPFFLVVLVLFGAIGLLAFIFQIFKSIIFFFTGQKFFPELPEDKELRLLREQANGTATALNQNQQPVYNEQPVNTNETITAVKEESSETNEPSIESVCFKQSEEINIQLEESDDDTLGNLVNEEPVQVQEQIEDNSSSFSPIKEEVLETSDPIEDEQEEEQLETYVPSGTKFISDDDDDDDSGDRSGVDIDYNV